MRADISISRSVSFCIIVYSEACKFVYGIASREKGGRALDAQRKHDGRLSVTEPRALDPGDELFRVSWSGRSTDRRMPVRSIAAVCLRDFFPARRVFLLASGQIKIARIDCQLRRSRFTGDCTALGIVSCTLYGSHRLLASSLGFTGLPPFFSSRPLMRLRVEILWVHLVVWPRNTLPCVRPLWSDKCIANVTSV